ncbi:MAG TPA: FkbM family methyltransferase [Candidatus Paceibacterota bacterium]|nr:FkbM family methyltransferase [Candidatus Paceibacterota bacterium]
MRIKFKQIFFKILGIKKTKEKFLGIEFSFSDYGVFSHLWREIFVTESYAFSSDTDSPTIIDVGSNIGMSICYFKKCYPKAKVIGFEPDPESFSYLKKNIELNKFSDVSIHNVAISANEGTLTFYQDKAVGASLVNSLKSSAMHGKKTTSINVPSRKLSGFINGKVDLMKIDIEGAEYGVFQEITGKLHNVHNIFLEVHQGEGIENEPIGELLKTLEDSGFRYAITGSWGFLSHADFISSPSRPYALMLDAKRYSHN